VLRKLLRNGLRGLPEPTTQTGRWGCGQAADYHICSKYRATGTLPLRIVFRARRR
jgi:hypothetical protein